MTRILLIEDNENLAFGLSRTLEGEGYEVALAEDGRSGLARARMQPSDLIILDVMLPEMDGFSVLRTLRGEGNGTPVLMLTARTEEAEKVFGFRLGADDYVTKPFGLAELTERVRAILRRARPIVAAPTPAPAQPEQVVERFGEVEVNTATRTVRRGGAAVALTPKEYALLLALIRPRGAVVDRLTLLREVWGYSADVVTRTVDLHVAELRRKLEPDPAAPRHILTVRKAGYRLEA